jgi:CRISPR-associated protein Cas1
MPGAERVLDFSEAKAHLSMRHEQLVIRADELAEVTVPLAEIAAVILTSPRITATQPALAGVMRHGGSIIVCDDTHQPTGMMLPLNANTMQTQRMLAQMRASVPTGKRLWKQIINEKVLSQAATLDFAGRKDAGLRALAKKIRSGDPSNIEGQASRRYWLALFDDPDFRRRRDADDQNRLLNYGYAVLRAGVGRAICAAGLHPSIGVHHHGRNNPWCLADDLMEPYRPLIDRAVVELVGLYGKTCPLDREAKSRLVATLSERLGSHGEARTVFDWLGRTAASLAQVFLDAGDSLFYPAGLRDG